MKVGIIAALPGELKPLVRGWVASAAKNGTHKWTQQRDDDVWIAVCSGMGADAARRSFAAAERDGPVDLVLSVGWAGALISELEPGTAHAMSMIVDAETGERFQLTGGKRKLTVATTAHVADAAEKIRLRKAYPEAVMVDMEAAVVACVAKARGIPVGCIKGISDGVGAELPDLNRFIDANGQLRLAPLLAHLALRPKYWGPTAALGKNSSKAAQAICERILEFMKEKNVDRLNRTGKL